MRKIVFTTLILCSICLSLAAQDAKKDTKKVSVDATSDVSLDQKASYIIGHDLGNRMVNQGFNVSFDHFFAGIKDGAALKQSRYTPEEVAVIMQEFQEYLRKKQQEIADQKKQAGVDFLAKNKTNKGIITTASGLQYKVIKEGTGKKPGLQDTVKTHYKGTFIDGTEFDSSYTRNQPAEFPVNAVIPGWTEALQLMKVGSKWELYVPSELAYGERGAGEAIPPNAVLVFEIELLEVIEPAPEKKED